MGSRHLAQGHFRGGGGGGGVIADGRVSNFWISDPGVRHFVFRWVLDDVGVRFTCQMHARLPLLLFTQPPQVILSAHR